MTRDASRLPGWQQFHLISSFAPTGSQPQAIEKLVAGLQAGEKGEACRMEEMRREGRIAGTFIPCWAVTGYKERLTPWTMS